MDLLKVKPRVKRRPKKKLSHINQTFYTIIAEAIIQDPERSLTVAQIYQKIEKDYGDYLNANWKNSVRHALSFKDFFVKVRRGPSPSGREPDTARTSVRDEAALRGSHWTLAPNYTGALKNVRRKRRTRDPNVSDLVREKNESLKRFHARTYPGGQIIPK